MGKPDFSTLIVESSEIEFLFLKTQLSIKRILI